MNYSNVPWAVGLPVKLYDGNAPKVGTKCTCGCGAKFVGLRDDTVCPGCMAKLMQPAGPPPPREIVCKKCRTLCTELDCMGLCPACSELPPFGDHDEAEQHEQRVVTKSAADEELEAWRVKQAGAGKSGPMLASMPDGSIAMRSAMRLSPLELDLTAQVCALRQEIDEAKAALNIPATVRLVDGVGRLRDKLRSAKRRATTGAARAY